MNSNDKQYRCMSSSWDLRSSLHFKFRPYELNCPLIKRHRSDTAVKHDETLDRGYDSRLYRPEWIRGDVVCRDDSSPGPIDGPIITEPDGAGVLERVAGLVTEFSDILLRAAKPGGARTSTQLFSLPADTSFELNIFKW